MTLEELNKEQLTVVEKPISTERFKENLELAKGLCPTCGYLIKKEPSQFSSCIWYVCQNPVVKNGHMFVRGS